jgi:chaperone modulatory protein CbpM
MKKHEIMIVADYSDKSPLTLSELCEICNISQNVVHEFISWEIVHPRQSAQQELIFELIDLRRIKTALRLQHDLEVNLAGVALVLDLLEELEELREKAKFLEKNV